MRDEAQQRIGHHYPKVTLPDGTRATVIAWIWARTVTCPNPACRITMPLVRSWWLGKKKGKEAYVVPEVVDGTVEFSIGHDLKAGPTAEVDGTVGRTGAVCVSCGSTVPLAYVRLEGQAGRMGAQLMATVGEGKRRRVYLAPDDEQLAASQVERPVDVPQGELAKNARDFKTPNYGMTHFADLFTSRQLIALTTFSDLVGEARERVLADALASGLTEGDRLAEAGCDAAAYADAVATYLGLATSRVADLNNSLVTWSSGRDQARNLFARQAIPMSWDFVEVSPFARAAGDVLISTMTAGEALDGLVGRGGTAKQASAQAVDLQAGLISTDPPYYDNIGYSDLSDFFYVWLRRSLGHVHGTLLSTLLVPKAEELVANPYRHGGKAGAQTFFESGFREVFAYARARASVDYPITVYYAFKQAEDEDGGTASTGWETLLDGMVRGGWRITGTWPMRSERGGRMLSVGTNALASSIVLALRPRADDAPVVDRRTFIAELRDALPDKLRELQQGSIAAVDLPQAAIGPGMAVFSHYAKVVEASGQAMSVRSALQVINQILAEVLSAQEGDFDAGSRWCVKWFESHGFADGLYGDAENLATAYATSIDWLARSGVVKSGQGKVRLLAPEELPTAYDPRTDDLVTLWEIVLHLAKALDEQGLDAAGLLLARATTRIDVDAAKELAYLLYSIAERNRWSAPALLFNTVAAAWSDVVDAGRRTTEDPEQQLALDTAY